MARSILLMWWGRLGSLNALESTRPARLWRRLLHRPLCSADTLGEVCARMDPLPLRQALHTLYSRLKRNKALPLNHGHDVAVLDGHESHCSYRRHCPGCLQRTVHTRHGDRIQYYHRWVVLMLLPGHPPHRPALRLLLDVEPQQPGEDEMAAARRLLQRVHQASPRAFDLLLADSLYGCAPFIDFVRSLGKHLLAVFKGPERDTYQQALHRMQSQSPRQARYRGRDCRWWDVEPVHLPLAHLDTLRVVRSEEFRPPSATPAAADIPPDLWMWLTTVPALQLPLASLVELAHQRWDIENYGFNETVNRWHADHVYRHHPHAMLTLWLQLCLAYNLYYAFCLLNLKPALRDGRPLHFWARLILAALYEPADPCHRRVPP